MWLQVDYSSMFRHRSSLHLLSLSYDPCKDMQAKVAANPVDSMTWATHACGIEPESAFKSLLRHRLALLPSPLLSSQ